MNELVHNDQVLDEAEKSLNELLASGTEILIRNPDGTFYQLKKGFEFYICTN